MITGEQDPPGSGNGGILLTDEKFGDFELQLDIKPDWGVCSGLFLRANDRGQCVQMMVDRLGTRPLVTQLPVGVESDYSGLIALLKMKRLRWESISEEPMPVKAQPGVMRAPRATGRT